MSFGKTIETPNPCDRFFYAGRIGFAMASDEGQLIPLPSESAVRQHLAQLGVSRSDMSATVCRIRENNFVSHIGELAGYPTGIHEQDGGKILVTRPPKIVQSAAGEFPTLEGIFRGLFESDSYPMQFGCVTAWLKRSRENVLAGRRRPTPALAIVGQRGAGKSLAIEIFRRSLGGRQAACYRALCGDSNFNADLCAAELLVVDDEAASRDHRARVRLGQGIKSTLFGGSVRFEGKGRDAFNARPVQSLVIALNSEPEHLQVLPEMDESLRDKIILSLAGEAQIPPELADDPEELGTVIDGELPAFLHWLEGWEIPAEMVDRRGRIVCSWHPDLLASLDGISPENRLAELLAQNWKIQKAIEDEGQWRGTAAEAEAALIESDTTRHAARTILNWPGATGTLLSRLAAGRSDYEKAGQRGGVQTYRIGQEGQKKE
jgi:hypothetical protein